MKQRKGFSLVELMVALAIAAILISVGVPSFVTMMRENRIVSQTNEMTSLIAYARSEAAKRPDTFIVLCPSADDTNCTNSAQWETGWIIISDTNGDLTMTASDNDEVLRVIQPLTGNNTLRTSGFNGNNFVRITATGAPESAGTFMLCDERGASEARGVVLGLSGQTRLAVDENDDGIVNTHAGAATNVACP